MSLTQEDAPTPNLPLLRKVLDHIDAHPDEWDQNQWAQQTPCGTTMCIAGHVAVMAGGQLAFTEGSDRTGYVSLEERLAYIPQFARNELGLTADEADSHGEPGVSLFSVYSDRDDVQAAAEAIAARAGERL